MVTLQQLIYFRELAHTGNQTRTAEQLYITQTTLSNTIRNLERQLGIRLFERSGRSLRLSEPGQKYLHYIDEALQALDNAQTVINDYKDSSEQSVSVAMTSAGVWSNVVYGFRSAYDSYNIRQINCGRDQFRPMLLEQQIDYAIVGTDDISLTGLEYTVICEETLFLCVSREHPLADREGIYLTQLRDEPFINLPESSGFRVFCDRLFERAGIPCHAVLECDYTLRGKLVAGGYGVAVTTNSSRRQNLLGTGITYIPILDDFARRPVAVVWNPRRYLSKAALDFRNYVLTRGNGTEQSDEEEMPG